MPSTLTPSHRARWHGRGVRCGEVGGSAINAADIPCPLCAAGDRPVGSFYPFMPVGANTSTRSWTDTVLIFVRAYRAGAWKRPTKKTTKRGCCKIWRAWLKTPTPALPAPIWMQSAPLAGVRMPSDRLDHSRSRRDEQLRDVIGPVLGRQKGDVIEHRNPATDRVPVFRRRALRHTACLCVARAPSRSGTPPAAKPRGYRSFTAIKTDRLSVGVGLVRHDPVRQRVGLAVPLDAPWSTWLARESTGYPSSTMNQARRR